MRWCAQYLVRWGIAIACAALPLVDAGVSAQAKTPEAARAEMEARMREAAALGPHHAALRTRIGRWDVYIAMVMPGVTTVYGTLDEYTTGELHQPFKAVTRDLDANRHVMEVWDLGIGEAGAKVVEFTFTRRP